MSNHSIQQFQSREFYLRTITSILIAPIFLAVYYFGGVSFLAGILLLTAGVSWEFYQICAQAGYKPARAVGSLAAILLVLAAFLKLEATWIVTIALFVTTYLWIDKSISISKDLIANWAITLLGFVYSGGLLHHFILLRNLPVGLVVGVLTLLGTWTTDTVAYLIGKKIGRRKFAPKISPNKTWEGAIGGFICSFIVVLFAGVLLNVPLLHTIILGLIIPSAVILGDVTESLLKRSANVKNASNLIPGHGGLLDRIDGLMFAMTIVYYYLVFFLMA